MNSALMLRTSLFLAAAAFLLSPKASLAQDPAPPAQAPPTETAKQQGPAPAAPIRLTLQDALDRARKNSTQYQAALTSAGLAREDRTQARDALLPSVAYNNSAIYTQGTGATQAKNTGFPAVFIANNAVHEYISQANIHEAIDVASVAAWRRASAAAAVARAQAEIASRGLVVTVVQGFYNVAAAQHKLETAKRGADEGDRFLKITQELEHGGEVAHSDVIKAELQMQDRRRQLQEAQLTLLNSRLDFSVLIFPDFNDNFEVVDDLHAAVPLPTLAEVQQQAARDNPSVRAALAAVQEANHDVLGARAGYLPSYIPIWNWGATQSRVKQADLRRAQAKRELSLAQRTLLAEMQSLYAEAETALNEQEGWKRSAELAEDSLRLTTLRYTQGEATVLEVVDAQTTYAQANAGYQDGAVRYRVALANLQTLTGVLTTP